MKKVLVYGTFDILHIGHINYLKRARALGDYVVVGLKTDAYSVSQHKQTTYTYAERQTILSALRYVDAVFPSEVSSWEQKLYDITEYEIDILVMSLDWRGQLDDLKNACDIVYLPRSRNFSQIHIKNMVL